MLKIEGGRTYLTSPCLWSNINTTKWIENSFAFTDNGRILHRRKVCRSGFERSVNCSNWNYSARSFDSSCWERVPWETDSIKFFLKSWIKWRWSYCSCHWGKLGHDELSLIFSQSILSRRWLPRQSVHFKIHHRIILIINDTWRKKVTTTSIHSILFLHYIPWASFLHTVWVLILLYRVSTMNFDKKDEDKVAVFHLDKTQVFQDARAFNASPIQPRKCRILLTKIKCMFLNLRLKSLY